MESKLLRKFIIGIFVSLYLFVSLISTIHVIDFFKLSNTTSMAIALAIAFEVGAAASLASIIVLEKMNKFIVWTLFILLTCFQMMGNAYYAYVHLTDYFGWIELFGLQWMDVVAQKRILAIISGAILPIVALGFIKALVDYIRPEEEKKQRNDAADEWGEENVSDNSSKINDKKNKNNELESDANFLQQNDPAFRKMVEEYINKTKRNAHVKTIPGTNI